MRRNLAQMERAKSSELAFDVYSIETDFCTHNLSGIKMAASLYLKRLAIKQF